MNMNTIKMKMNIIDPFDLLKSHFTDEELQIIRIKSRLMALIVKEFGKHDKEDLFKLTDEDIYRRVMTDVDYAIPLDDLLMTLIKLGYNVSNGVFSFEDNKEHTAIEISKEC